MVVPYRRYGTTVVRGRGTVGTVPLPRIAADLDFQCKKETVFCTFLFEPLLPICLMFQGRCVPALSVFFSPILLQLKTGSGRSDVVTLLHTTGTVKFYVCFSFFREFLF